MCRRDRLYGEVNGTEVGRRRPLCSTRGTRQQGLTTTGTVYTRAASMICDRLGRCRLAFMAWRCCRLMSAVNLSGRRLLMLLFDKSTASAALELCFVSAGAARIHLCVD